MRQQATLQKMYNPFFVCPFQLQLVFGEMSFKKLKNWLIHKYAYPLCMINVIFNDMTLNEKIVDDSMQV